MPPDRPITRAVRRMNDRMNALLHRASIALLGQDGRPMPLKRLPTGLACLDVVLDGGLPRGRVLEVFGPPGGGKTALALALVAGAQRHGCGAAYIDAEAALDAGRAARAGVELSRLVAARPSSGEQAMQLVDALLRSRAAELVVVDSVAALVPRAELLAPVGEAPSGLHARLMSQALRRVVTQSAAAGAVVVFLNQQRTAFDEEGRAALTTTGGHALHFYAGTRLEVKRRDRELLVRVAKDRFGAEGRFCQLAFADGAVRLAGPTQVRDDLDPVGAVRP